LCRKLRVSEYLSPRGNKPVAADLVVEVDSLQVLKGDKGPRGARWREGVRGVGEMM
jgi:hypothetical protein